MNFKGYLKSDLTFQFSGLFIEKRRRQLLSVSALSLLVQLINEFLFLFAKPRIFPAYMYLLDGASQRSLIVDTVICLSDGASPVFVSSGYGYLFIRRGFPSVRL
jgi:hypothetical protein